MKTSEGTAAGGKMVGTTVFGRLARMAALVCVIAPATILLLAAGCESEYPEQPTVVVTKQPSGDLPSNLLHRNRTDRRLTILGGQVLRRVDTPVGRYFLVRAMKLTEDSYPQPPKSKIVFVPDITTAFILVVPSHRINSFPTPKTHISQRRRSFFVVLGEKRDLTVDIGPGHLLTAVGEPDGILHFPGQPKGPRYLLLKGRYILLWTEANPSDYPPIGE